MKAALLLCDHVSTPYQAQFGDYTNMFADLFPELNFDYYDVINGQYPQNLEEYDVYMATGSRHSAYEDLEWIHRLKAIIREIYQRKQCFVGFCFGHQLLGEALGGKVEKSPKGWCVGVHEFELKQSADWMRPNQDPINLLMMCQDQVLVLPEGAKVLAGNDHCPVGMFQIGHTMLGVQAHPEFSKAYDRLLMELRVDRMGEKVVQEGIESLNKEVHRQVIRDWVIKFCEQHN